MTPEYKRVASERRGRRPPPAANKALRRIAAVFVVVVISGVGALGLSCGGTPAGSLDTPDTEDSSDAGSISSPQAPVPSEPDAEDCVNGIDDDGDGGADCEDADCVQTVVCAAPPLDQSAPTSTADMAAFLYTGSDPSQKEVDPAIFEAKRIAVLRGQVFDYAGQPLSGVRVTVVRESAYGYTETDAKGTFNLVINGGGRIIVQYEKAGFLRAQRTIQTEWQHVHWLPEVVLLQRDPVVTEIATGVDTVQVAQGSRVADESGVRQATLLFPAEVQAQVVDGDGQTMPLTKLSVRATEYTVGYRGPQAMPGTLPPASAYTYAVELSVDEADALGVTTVMFDKPVGLYVDNFLGFPVGESVPVGYYDHAKSQWIPAQDGIVLAIVDTTGGIAMIDIDGDGIPQADEILAALGIDQGERAQLAALYEPGKTLWWAPIPHFSPWDCNWPYGLPDGAAGPPPELLERLKHRLDRPCERAGSIIACESQVLGERIDIPATPVVLSYQTNHTAGYAQEVTREIALSRGSLSDLVQAVEVEITIAGQKHVSRYHPQSDSIELKHTFTWNRRDGYGRTVQGAQHANIRIGYDHGFQPAQISRMQPDGTTELVASGTGYWGLTQGPDGSMYTLGADMVQQVHANGKITVVAGGGELSAAHGEVATGVRLASPRGLTRGPDGTLYFVHWAEEPYIYQLHRALSGFGADTLVIPSDDGAEMYIFDSKGHHLETRDALTGVTLLAFVYDAHWRLTRIIDRDGLRTEIERDAAGLAQAIIGPYGQRTELQYDPEQRLALVRYPDGRDVSFGYHDSDLLAWMRDFRGGLHEYRYDARGRLVSDTGPTQFTQSLQRRDIADGYEVAVTTNTGRVTSYRVEHLDKTTQKRTTELASGLVGEKIRNDAIVHRRAPDGTVTQVQLGPDPRFGMSAPYARQATLITPQGRTLMATSERAAELADPHNPLSLRRLTDEHTVLGRSAKTVFDISTRTIEHTSPVGRRITIYLDDKGRPSEVHRPGLAPVQYAYDDDGRLTSVRQGSGD